MFKRKIINLNKLTVLYIFLLTFYCFSMEKDSSFFIETEHSHNRFIFNHDFYTVCYDDANIENTTVVKLNQEDMERLLTCSKVLQNSLAFCGTLNDIEVPPSILLPQTIDARHLQLLLKSLKGSFKDFEPLDWYALFGVFDILDVQDADLKENLHKKYEFIAHYCYSHRLDLPKSPEFLQKFKQFQFERYKELTLTLLATTLPETITRESIPIPLDEWDNPITSQASKKIQHLALSKDGNKLFFLSEYTAYAYEKNNNGKFILINKLENISAGGLSPDGSTIMVKDYLQHLFSLTWYSWDKNKITKKGTSNLPSSKNHSYDCFSRRNHCGELEKNTHALAPTRISRKIDLSEDGRVALTKLFDTPPR